MCLVFVWISDYFSARPASVGDPRPGQEPTISVAFGALELEADPDLKPDEIRNIIQHINQVVDQDLPVLSQVKITISANARQVIPRGPKRQVARGLLMLIAERLEARD